MPQMKSFGMSETEYTDPLWAADGIKEMHLIPNGAFLNIPEFIADYTDLVTGKIMVPGGTLVGRTYTERTAKQGFGPADVATDDEIYLTALTLDDLQENEEASLYRHQRLIYENFLPDWSSLSAAQKAWIRANYQCILGVE